jgi:pimeloyl-ACP methyl ester carboxylesterase
VRARRQGAGAGLRLRSRGPQIDVLVGHSYGGFVTTNAATGDRNVKALVYVDAYIPAQDDTINSINAQFPGSQITPAALNFVPSPGGVTDAYIKPSLFHSIFANDLPASQAAELAAVQRPIAATALTEPSGPPGPPSRAGT